MRTYRTIFGAIAAVAILGTSTACTSHEKSESSAPATTSAVTTSAPATTAAPAAQATYAPVTEMKSEDLKVGTGAAAEPGKTVEVQYTGWLTNGTKFDSSYDHGQSFKFRLSKEGVAPPQVIQGWDKGLLGMKVGGKRRLIIPPQMGYGDRGAPPVIPPGATLVFEVELLGVN